LLKCDIGLNICPFGCWQNALACFRDHWRADSVWQWVSEFICFMGGSGAWVCATWTLLFPAKIAKKRRRFCASFTGIWDDNWLSFACFRVTQKRTSQGLRCTTALKTLLK